MMEVLHFVFDGFWHFAGTVVILAVVFGGIGGMFSRGCNCKDDD